MDRRAPVCGAPRYRLLVLPRADAAPNVPPTAAPLRAALKPLRRGDILIDSKLDRLGRDVRTSSASLAI
jgi:hypothetical protein